MLWLEGCRRSPNMACVYQFERTLTTSCEVRFLLFLFGVFLFLKRDKNHKSRLFRWELKMTFHSKKIKIVLHNKQIQIAFHGKNIVSMGNKWNSPFTAIKNQIISLLTTCAMKVRKKFFLFSTWKSWFMNYCWFCSSRIENLAYPYTKSKSCSFALGHERVEPHGFLHPLTSVVPGTNPNIYEFNWLWNEFI